MFKVNHKNSIAIVIYFHNCSFIFDDFFFGWFGVWFGGWFFIWQVRCSFLEAYKKM